MRPFIYKVIVVFVLFCPGRSVCCQSQYEKISSQDYYNFFNSLADPDSVHEFNLENKADLTYILEDTTLIFSDTSLFSKADIQFIKYQIQEAQSFRWESNRIAGSTVISSKKISKIFKKDIDEGWKKFNRIYGKGFSTFSVPLFTVDRNTCIVYKAGHCGGLCGHGGTSVYKKINGKWTYVKPIGMVWVS
jgi:hypothetical protein